MDEKLRNYYLETQIKSSSPGQMLIMLYDALIQNAETAEAEIAATDKPNDLTKAANCVATCINIMTELSTSLKHEFDPKLCATLSDLYRFFMKEFSDAYEKRQAGKIKAILPLIRDLRATWFEADRQANRFQPVAA
jgi:flagellar protein FliS